MKLPDRAALGTMHNKAAAVTPPLARLGITVVVPEGLDTDRFGTFTTETPRTGTMEDAARAKARAAIAATGLCVGIASEGAYGPHPVIPFLPIGRDVLLWRNEETGQEVIERLTDEAPCFDHVTAFSADEATAFLETIGFPRTAVIVARASAGAAPLAKGLQDRDAVDDAIARALHLSAKEGAFLQTDMRAHLNPRRMETIGRLAERLAVRLGTACPACTAPGWGLLRMETGLPCAWCDGPTLMVKAEVHGCTLCKFETNRPRTNGPTVADPGHCPACNPWDQTDRNLDTKVARDRKDGAILHIHRKTKLRIKDRKGARYCRSAGEVFGAIAQVWEPGTSARFCCPGTASIGQIWASFAIQSHAFCSMVCTAELRDPRVLTCPPEAPSV